MQPGHVHGIPVPIGDGALGHGVGEVIVAGGPGGVQGVHIHDGPGLLRHGVHRAHMVIVPVGQENGPAFQAVVLKIIQNGVALVTRVDDHTFQRGFVGDHVAVGLQLAHGQGFDQHKL